jgi:hypothetical protein
MFARWTFVIALAGLLVLVGPSAARADSETAVRDYLKAAGAFDGSYTLTQVTDAEVVDAFEDFDFFEVIFRQWPVPVLPPKGLSASNVFVVDAVTEDVVPLVQPADLVDFFFAELAPVADETEAHDAGIAFLRLDEVFSQDGFYTFHAPRAGAWALDDGQIWVWGQVTVQSGGKGFVRAFLTFDEFGALSEIDQGRRVRPGVRPICQATKLLDADPLVRRMAEQDLLVMGRSAKGYLDEQRAKAKPELKQAIDRLWKRIVAEGW